MAIEYREHNLKKSNDKEVTIPEDHDPVELEVNDAPYTGEASEKCYFNN